MILVSALGTILAASVAVAPVAAVPCKDGKHGVKASTPSIGSDPMAQSPPVVQNAADGQPASSAPCPKCSGKPDGIHVAPSDAAKGRKPGMPCPNGHTRSAGSESGPGGVKSAEGVNTPSRDGNRAADGPGNGTPTGSTDAAAEPGKSTPGGPAPAKKPRRPCPKNSGTSAAPNRDATAVQGSETPSRNGPEPASNHGKPVGNPVDGSNGASGAEASPSRGPTTGQPTEDGSPSGKRPRCPQPKNGEGSAPKSARPGLPGKTKKVCKPKTKKICKPKTKPTETTSTPAQAGNDAPSTDSRKGSDDDLSDGMGGGDGGDTSGKAAVPVTDAKPSDKVANAVTDAKPSGKADDDGANGQPKTPASAETPQDKGSKPDHSGSVGSTVKDFKEQPGKIRVTPHYKYSSSVGVLGCMIDVGYAAYWPGTPSCNELCVKIKNGDEFVHVLRIDSSGSTDEKTADGAVSQKTHDIGPSAWAKLTRNGPDDPTVMEWEPAPMSACKDFIKTPSGKMPFAAISGSSFYSSCVEKNDGNWISQNYEPYAYEGPRCELGSGDMCTYNAETKMPKCPKGVPGVEDNAKGPRVKDPEPKAAAAA